MKSALYRLAATLLFFGLVVALTLGLEAVARTDWLGPVIRGSLEGRFDAGALFYTEVDIDALRTADTPDAPSRPER